MKRSMPYLLLHMGCPWKPGLIFFVAALLATFAGGSDAWARPPRPRIASGVIEAVEPSAGVLRLRLPNRCEPLVVTWDAHTRFFEEHRSVTASRVQAGMQVTLSYRTPFFGERYATKIVLKGRGRAVSTP